MGKFILDKLIGRWLNVPEDLSFQTDRITLSTVEIKVNGKFKRAF